MDALILAAILFAVFALVALGGAAESRDGFDGAEAGRSLGR